VQDAVAHERIDPLLCRNAVRFKGGDIVCDEFTLHTPYIRALLQGGRQQYRVGIARFAASHNKLIENRADQDAAPWHGGSGQVAVWKVSSTPDDPSRGIAHGLAEGAAGVGARA